MICEAHVEVAASHSPEQQSKPVVHAWPNTWQVGPVAPPIPESPAPEVSPAVPLPPEASVPVPPAAFPEPPVCVGLPAMPPEPDSDELLPAVPPLPLIAPVTPPVGLPPLLVTPVEPEVLRSPPTPGAKPPTSVPPSTDVPTSLPLEQAETAPMAARGNATNSRYLIFLYFRW